MTPPNLLLLVSFSILIIVMSSPLLLNEDSLFGSAVSRLGLHESNAVIDGDDHDGCFDGCDFELITRTPAANMKQNLR